MITPPIWIHDIHITDYAYTLPEECIAKYPLPERDQSKILIYQNGEISQSQFYNLDQILKPGTLLVFNNTRVFPARLNFTKNSGGNIEIFCLEPINPPEYQLAFQSNSCTWKCIVGNIKRWKNNKLQKEISFNNFSIVFTATKIADFQSYQYIEFTWEPQSLTFAEIIESAGVTPIPPYLNRSSEVIDRERYQTVYSKILGSVAAPTAGLHFTGQLMDKLKDHGILNTNITLHVGAGTFMPLHSDHIAEHEMHPEFFTVSIQTIRLLYQYHNQLISIGTTTLRTLESLYWIANKIKLKLANNEQLYHIDQWEPYHLEGNMTFHEAMAELIDYMERYSLDEITATTRIIIVPGYQVRSVSALITNFHQPKSTLLLLLSAITGDNWKKIYSYALNNGFRFLSYGDSSLIYI